LRDAAKAAQVSCVSILEPVGRNTSAAMAVAALNADPGQRLLFLPADHHVPDVELFAKTIEQGLVAAEKGAIVTFGVRPTCPHTGYGYMQVFASLGEREDGTETQVLQVKRFVEKPDQENALSYLVSGDYYWNAGIFLVNADVLVQAFKKYAPDIFEVAQQAVDAQKRNGNSIHLDADIFSACRSESIDYAVLEPLSNNTPLRENGADKIIHDSGGELSSSSMSRNDASIFMVPFQGVWSDVGNWNAVAALADADSDNNHVTGKGKAYSASSTYIYAPYRPVVALGTKDLLIVDTVDAVLVSTKSHAEKVKDIVTDLQKQGISQAFEHRYVVRPWGEYNAIDEGSRFKVKRIKVKAGASLSLQLHHHRAEHWIVVKGTARVTRGRETFLLAENESTFIPVGTKHRLENPGTIPLEMIEVQSGSYLGEDDIKRFDDHYGRAN